MSMMQPPVRRILPSDVELSNTIRRSWVNTAGWIRNFILSSVFGILERDTIVRRLYQTIDETGIFYTQYYGEEVGNRVRTIYQNYFRDVDSMIEAYQSGNMEAIEQARASMYKDADEFAALLSSINRFWDYATLQALFYVLVESTEGEIAGVITGDYEKEVAAYDQYVEQIYDISDELTYGMIRQFSLT